MPDEQDTHTAGRTRMSHPLLSRHPRIRMKAEVVRAGWDEVLVELVWRGCRRKGGDEGKSSVMDRSRQSVLREGRRGDIVRDVAEVGDSTGAATRTALRGGARQCRRLELPLAVHTSESSRATSLVTPSACGATSWQIRAHSASDMCAQPSTSTLATKPDLSPK